MILLYQVWDTAGQEALSSLRKIAYNDTDLFLLAYDMTNKDSLYNLQENWLPEIEEEWDGFHDIVMVGTKFDFWEEKEADGDNEDCVTEDEVKAVMLAIVGQCLV